PPPPPAHGLSCSLSSARRIWIDAPTNQILKDLKSQILLPRVCYAKSF
ncbi:Os12g0509900, partial [Oryza sativa Japonica Group]